MLDARSRRWATGLVVATVAALALTAVAPITATGAASVRGFDGTTIKIAGLGIASNFGKADLGTKARIKRFNDTNEIKGIKLEYEEFADDKQDPATTLSEARRLVTQVGVFAIVPDLSRTNPVDYFTQQHLPYFGYGFDNTYCSNKPTTKLWGVSYVGCQIPTNPPYVSDIFSGVYNYVSQKTGKKHPSIVLFSQDTGGDAVARATAQAKGAGYNVVYAKANVPPQATDYSPFISQWMTADGGKPPDQIQCQAAVQCLSIWTALNAAGYKGLYWSPLNAAVLQKAMVGTIAWNFYNSQPSKALTKLQADFDAVQPGAALDNWNTTAYFATDMFIQALKTAAKKGTSNITPENVQKAAATQTWQIKGLVGPQTYPAATVASAPQCNETQSDTPTGWVIVEPYTCSAKTFKMPKS